MKRFTLFQPLFKLAAPVLAVGFIIAFPRVAHASYVANNLIANSAFTNNATMNQAQIQAFLEGKSGVLDTYSDTEVCTNSYMTAHYGHCGQRVLASQIIYDTANAYGINPQAIIATMQKEESLITDSSPADSQINFAMGYACPDSGSCGTVSGFFNQVDWGTWQLRLNYARALGDNSWVGSDASPASLPYACADGRSTNANHKYYSVGLYPGSSVTFYDDSATAYTTLTLANAATASLYCYTPHVYSTTSSPPYSGSINFVNSYEAWFGSTQGVDYSWSASDITFYKNGDDQTGVALSNNNVQGNMRYYAVLSAINTGNQSWSNSNFPVRLGTFNPSNHGSALYDSTWYNQIRTATLRESSVAPGATGHFGFYFNVPNRSGTYLEDFNAVAEGSAWMTGGAYTINLNITPSVYSWTLGSPGQTSDASTGFTLLPGQTANFTLKAKNTGNVTWTNTANPVRLSTWLPTAHNSPFCADDTNWVAGCYRAATMQDASVAPQSTGTFTFKVHAPSTPGFYVEHYNLVMEGVSWFQDAGVEFDVNVTRNTAWHMVSQTSTNGWDLAKSQFSQVTLTAHNDGNMTWTNSANPVRLSTWLPTAHNSPFCSDNTNWVVGCYRAATLREGSVPPGSDGHFDFTVQAPQKTGFYSERYNLVMEGITWFNDPWLEFDFTVH